MSLLPVLLVLGTVAACGSDSGGDDNPVIGSDALEGAAAFTVSGDVGTIPQVTWKSQMKASKVEASTLVEGTGHTLAKGEKAYAQIWIGNGITKKEAYSTYDEGEKAELLTVNDDLPDYLKDVQGSKVGTRIVATAPSTDIFGEAGNSAMGVGNDDTVVIVVDVVSQLLAKTDGTKAASPKFAPKIVATAGKPTGFDFTGTPAPTDKLQVAVLQKGEGDVVKKGQTIAVRYLGEVFGAKKPFDENYSKDVTQFQIGVKAVIVGWDRALVGQTVGSRVVMVVPSDLAYGKAGNTGAKIKPNSDLVFVVDILSAY